MDKPCVVLDRYSSVMHSVHVTLCNTETGEEQYLQSGFDYISFCRAVGSFNPYGFVPQRVLDNGKTLNSSIIVQIDDLSLKFLDYIKSVYHVSEDDSELGVFIAGLKNWVVKWNIDGTILELSGTSGQYACPIFQMICYQQIGWLNDKFYFRVGPRESGNGLCVEFNDAQKARVFIAKALTLGYNPMKDRSQSRFARRGKI